MRLDDMDLDMTMRAHQKLEQRATPPIDPPTRLGIICEGDSERRLLVEVMKSSKVLVVRITPPLFRLDRIARFFWSDKTYQLVFKPERAEIEHEYLEAEKNGEIWRARWIRYVRGPHLMLSCMLGRLPFSLLGGLAKLFRA